MMSSIVASDVDTGWVSVPQTAHYHCHYHYYYCSDDDGGGDDDDECDDDERDDSDYYDYYYSCCSTTNSSYHVHSSIPTPNSTADTNFRLLDRWQPSCDHRPCMSKCACASP